MKLESGTLKDRENVCKIQQWRVWRVCKKPEVITDEPNV